MLGVVVSGVTTLGLLLLLPLVLLLQSPWEVTVSSLQLPYLQNIKSRKSIADDNAARRTLWNWEYDPRGESHSSSFRLSLVVSASASSDFAQLPVGENETSPLLLSSLSLDPTSAMAAKICLETLQLTVEQYDQLQKLTEAVCGWNEKLNLVSRKDCQPSTVFARHVLPSLAYSCHHHGQSTTSLFDSDDANDDDTSHSNLNRNLFATAPDDATTPTRVMDVGTGGGFPGLPLAIQYPTTTFVLADSVGKKVTAVADMAARLKLSNVQTYHGRVEHYRADCTDTPAAAAAETATTTTTTATADPKKEWFDVVTGRSVTSLPQFCAWVVPLLRPDTGHLVYWIGGEIDSDILQHAMQTTAVQDVMPDWHDHWDKKVLVFPVSAVRKIAAMCSSSNNSRSGRGGQGKVSTAATRNKSSTNQQRRREHDRPPPKGEWRKRDVDEPRQRGHENFQRYSSNTGVGPKKPLEM